MPDGTIAEGKSPTVLRKERRRHTFDWFDLIFFSSSDDDDDDDDDESDDNFDLWWELRAVEDEE